MCEKKQMNWYSVCPMVAASGKRKKEKKAPESYRERTYRGLVDSDGLVSSQVTVRETDLHILAPVDVSGLARDAVLRYRIQVENHISRDPDFLHSLVPLAEAPLAPKIVREMIAAGRAASVGPMAAVAGAVAEFVGRDLLGRGCDEVMVENGGDIFLHRKTSCVAAVFAGESPLSQRIGITIPAHLMPLGICTSSGTVGHSLSLGRADAVTVLAASTPLADAAATRLGNEVKSARDIEHALGVGRGIPGLLGILIVVGGQLGVWGEFELVRLG